MSFWQRYYSGGEDIEAAEDALEAFALLNLASFSAGHLSQGQARRLGLARLVAARRPVWLLDEPQAALDTASTRLLESAIAAHLSSGGLAIISTHLDLALPDAQVLELGMLGGCAMNIILNCARSPHPVPLPLGEGTLWQPLGA